MAQPKQPAQGSIAERLYPHLVKNKPTPEAAKFDGGDGGDAFLSALASFGLAPKRGG